LIILAAITVVKGNYFSRAHLLFTYGIFLIGLYLWRISYFYALRRYRKKGSNFRNVVVIGAGIVGHDIYKYINADEAIGYKLLGFFEDNPQESFHPDKILGSVKDFEKFVTETKVDQVFIAIPLTQRRVIRE